MEKQGKILIIDDNEDVLFALNALLTPLYEKIRITVNPEKIPDFQRNFKPDLYLLDMNFKQDAVSGREGFQWLAKILDNEPDAVVVMMTAYTDTNKVVQAIKAGATDFITKPWEKEKLLATVSSALKLSRSQQQIETLKSHVQSLTQTDEPEIIGKSEGMLAVFEMINQLSDTEANILLLGENGTGKDLIAKYIFHHSPRYAKPFATIDLGAVPETLFESELFGYVKGAFTDARTDKAGRMEIASGGTLFLNEIGNLSLQMQAKLLTAIEKKEITRLGSTRMQPVDVRFICATNLDIYEAVARGDFRQDLLYRINTLEIRIPPLRERGDDIILLANWFLNRYANYYKKNISGLTPEAKHKLLTYPFPGNVRELQNIIERAVILSGTGMLQASAITIPSHHNKKRISEETLNLDMLEREAIDKALRRTGGNLAKAAELLGITRFSLYRKIK
ncbi:MAG: sigma-54 dependent transcriptional regulator [Tannerella sp.]|jgi:DNA-binding NtrC family response regulator|nr:sigma-54 dependent transcriptional regulator [Tannerella sp.]